jgi:undecaprenyl-diphosphatase
MSERMAHVMLFITFLADPLIIILVQITLVITLALVKEEILAAFFVSSLMIGTGLSTVVKNIVARPRPLSLYINAHGYSFPSGHSLIAMVFYGFLGFCLYHTVPSKLKRCVIALSTGLIIFLIGISRIMLGVHWPSDVLGGWALGGAVLLILIMTFTTLKKKVVHPLRPQSHKTIGALFVILVVLGFCISFYYVTHAVGLRSILIG